MNWLSLNTSRHSPHLAMLREVFDVNFKELQPHAEHPQAWVRGLTDRSTEPAPSIAWIDLATGNIVLIEAIGAEDREGIVQARLWLQPGARTINLLAERLVTYARGLGALSREAAFAQVVAVVSKIEALGIPDAASAVAIEDTFA